MLASPLVRRFSILWVLRPYVRYSQIAKLKLISADADLLRILIRLLGRTRASSLGAFKAYMPILDLTIEEIYEISFPSVLLTKKVDVKPMPRIKEVPCKTFISCSFSEGHCNNEIFSTRVCQSIRHELRDEVGKSRRWHKKEGHVSAFNFGTVHAKDKWKRGGEMIKEIMFSGVRHLKRMCSQKKEQK